MLAASSGLAHAKDASCSLGFHDVGEKRASAGKAPLETKDAPSPDLKGVEYVSADNVEKLRDSGKADPAMLAFMSDAGPLGYNGTVGPWSAANQLGPVGTKPWNPSVYVSASDHTTAMGKLGKFAPTGSEGPLGKNGALGKAAYDNILPAIPDGSSLREGGPLMVLGPKGVLGPYGSLGPLGPTGGFLRDPKTGAFVKDGKIITQIAGAGPEGATKLNLVELYQPDYAAKLSRLGQLDGNFVVDAVAKEGKSAIYSVNVKGGDWVNFLASPEGIGDRFRVELLNTDGKVFASSNSKDLVNFVSARFPKDTVVRVKVTNMGPSPFNLTPFVPEMSMTDTFRLHVISAPAESVLKNADVSAITQLQ